MDIEKDEMPEKEFQKITIILFRNANEHIYELNKSIKDKHVKF